jgi:stearoyl-CoA desaturase (Delta-9 desaturase)
MNAPLPKAPFNWVAIFALVFLPIVAVIAIPLYAFQHDFSLAAWISMFVLLGVSSLGITAGYHRLWAHRAYEARSNSTAHTQKSVMLKIKPPQSVSLADSPA